MKRFLSMLLAIAMLLSLTSTMVFAEEPEYGVEEPGTTEGDDFDVGFGELVDPIPGATAENPIVIAQNEWVPVEMGTTAPISMTYTVEIPVGATRYFYVGGYIAEYVLTAGEEAIELTGDPRQGYTFSFTNNDTENTAVVIGAALPLGSLGNPEVIETLEYTYFDISQAQGDSDGYNYIYTAPADGTVTLYFTNLPSVVTEEATYDEETGEELTPAVEEKYVGDIVVQNLTSYANYTLLNDGVDNYGLELQIPVVAGDELAIQVVCAEDNEGNLYPEADITWCGNFAYPAGSEQNPINIEWVWNDEYTTATATVTVPAGQTQYFNGNEAMILTANGNPVEQSETGVFSLTEGEYALVMSTPVGAFNNPEVIENIDGYTDTNSLEADGAYYYIWTATEDGTVTLDVTDGANITVDKLTYTEDSEWPISEQFELAEATTDVNYNYTGWNVAENLAIEVVAGQQLKIQVNGLTDWSTWTTPAIEYTLTGEFEAAYTPWEVTVSGITLDMASELFISAKLALPDELRNDPGTTVTITFNGNTTELNVVEYIAANGVDNRNRFSIKQPIASPYMDKMVTISVIDADGNYANLINSGTTYEGSFNFGVQTYMDLVFAQGDNYKTTKDAIAALLTYGAAAQAYFKAKGVANISDTPCTEMLTKYGYSAVDMSGFALTDITDALVTSGDETIGVSFKNGTPALDAAVYMTVKFESDGSYDMDAYTFTLTYYDASVSQEKTMDLAPYLDNKGRFCVDILNIAAAHFDYGYTVTVTHNESGKSFSAQYSVMAYCKMAIEAYANNPSQVNSVNLYKSMYYYNQAANALFE